VVETIIYRLCLKQLLHLSCSPSIFLGWYEGHCSFLASIYIYPHEISLSVLTKRYLLHSPSPRCSSKFRSIGFLLFILYTTPLSSLISDSSVQHHLYDSQLFIPFFAQDLSQNVSHLETIYYRHSLYLDVS